ncbi:hypothetical protein [Sphingobacterium psychroaquaticum]|uniref:DUF4374 domain-containing protein n=1 Tax=Sphingobacterium psychroaquaticum TaxID=561061 RepID=A0A1X7J4B9_9SPHI|nr:hypothetical protein [Sphingobacterium psychroaquaticum]SMG22298.1 hypothetical protein SAMN05660862_1419 [Sphingobacterium psychroaquaticum]
MRKISYIYKTFIAVALLVGVYACEREDGEPKLDTKTFSRLYVSFEEYSTSSAAKPLVNVRIIYPADSSTFNFALAHTSSAKGGGPIYFNPYLKTLFQGSANRDGILDTAVYFMNIGVNTGLLSNNGRMGNRYYDFVKGFGYESGSETFFIVNGQGENAGIYLVYRPLSKNGYARPFKKLRNSGLTMSGGVYASKNFFTVNTAAKAGGIYVFEDIINTEINLADSIGKLNPTRTIAIPDARNLRDLAYDSVKNILVVADVVDTAVAGSGRILIFEKFSEKIKESVIEPTRIITGVKTLLREPTSVAIDNRSTGQYIYVADRWTKMIMRFKISDSGDVEPDKSVSTEAQGRPVGLALDTRDASTLGQ